MKVTLFYLHGLIIRDVKGTPEKPGYRYRYVKYKAINLYRVACFQVYFVSY